MNTRDSMVDWYQRWCENFREEILCCEKPCRRIFLTSCLCSLMWHMTILLPDTAIQLRLYSSTETWHYVESSNLFFFQLRRAENSRLERNKEREREERKGLVRVWLACTCGVICPSAPCKNTAEGWHPGKRAEWREIVKVANIKVLAQDCITGGSL